MSEDMLERREFNEIVASNWAWLGPDAEPAIRRIERHDNAQRVYIDWLETKLAEYEHIGTGAGMEVKHDYGSR